MQKILSPKGTWQESTNVAGAFGGVNGAPGESGKIYTGVNNAINVFSSGGNLGSLLFSSSHESLEANVFGDD